MPRWLADLRHERSLRYLGGAVLASFAVALFAGFMILAYQLTAARVPEHRAALEHLVIDGSPWSFIPRNVGP